MAHTEESHLRLETQYVVLSGRVGRADHGWLNEGANERVLVRVALSGAKQLWA